ncbi:hypothetical protein Ancab_008015, partial [Ancistrocladus abbreviatus]
LLVRLEDLRVQWRLKCDQRVRMWDKLGIAPFEGVKVLAAQSCDIFTSLVAVSKEKLQVQLLLVDIGRDVESLRGRSKKEIPDRWQPPNPLHPLPLWDAKREKEDSRKDEFMQAYREFSQKNSKQIVGTQNRLYPKECQPIDDGK